MKVLNKKCVVIYDKNGFILTSTENNSETYVAKGHKYAEFDTPAELSEFIAENGLIEKPAE